MGRKCRSKQSVEPLRWEGNGSPQKGLGKVEQSCLSGCFNRTFELGCDTSRVLAWLGSRGGLGLAAKSCWCDEPKTKTNEMDVGHVPPLPSTISPLERMSQSWKWGKSWPNPPILFRFESKPHSRTVGSSHGIPAAANGWSLFGQDTGEFRAWNKIGKRTTITANGIAVLVCKLCFLPVSFIQPNKEYVMWVCVKMKL